MAAPAVTPQPAHPAKYSTEIIDVTRRLVRAEQRRLDRPITVLDPFAGVGRVHQLARDGEITTVGVEIEPEWAACHEDTVCADALEFMRNRPEWAVDVIVTSPTYGNRFADHHDARDASSRHSYAHDLGRMPSEASSSTLPWGEKYWQFHAEAYRAMLGVLRPASGDELGGLLLLNVSDFVKAKALVPAVMWHRGALHGAGFVGSPGERARFVTTSRMRFGQNHEARAASEVVLRMRRP